MVDDNMQTSFDDSSPQQIHTGKKLRFFHLKLHDIPCIESYALRSKHLYDQQMYIIGKKPSDRCVIHNNVPHLQSM
jgi:hypothetical protein